MREYKLDKSMIIVSETDEKGRVLYVNEDLCKVAQFSKDEIIGKPHSIVRHSDMPKAAFKDLWQTVKRGNIWNGIVKNKTKDGGYYWVYATVYPTKYKDETRYVSVRVRPSDDEVENAKKLYEKLS